MNRFKVFDPVTSSSIQLMIDQNYNLNKIVNSINKERNLSLTCDTVKSYIHRTFHKEWDKEKKRWIDCTLDPKQPKDYIDGQIEFDLEDF